MVTLEQVSSKFADDLTQDANVGGKQRDFSFIYELFIYKLRTTSSVRAQAFASLICNESLVSISTRSFPRANEIDK